MTLGDLVLRLGAGVERGEVELDFAVGQVVKFAAGGLTELGARDWLRHWRPAGVYEPFRLEIGEFDE